MKVYIVFFTDRSWNVEPPIVTTRNEGWCEALTLTKIFINWMMQSILPLQKILACITAKNKISETPTPPEIWSCNKIPHAFCESILIRIIPESFLEYQNRWKPMHWHWKFILYWWQASKINFLRFLRFFQVVIFSIFRSILKPPALSGIIFRLR